MDHALSDTSCASVPSSTRSGKTVGIMQPYFLPYFEQFRMMAACDLWVVFDTAQYTRKSWMNRNRILNRDKGWAYIGVPVRHQGLETPVGRTLIDDGQDWRLRCMNQLKVYAHEAPHYAQVRSWLESALGAKLRTLAELNTRLLRAVNEALGIRTPMCLASELDIDWQADRQPGEWALHIALKVGATACRNASGGVALFDPAMYAEQGIQLSFHEHRDHDYPTGSFDFVPGLSIVDWMMWNDQRQLRAWLS